MAIPTFEYTATVSTFGRTPARQGTDIPVLAFKALYVFPTADVSDLAFESDDAESEQDLKQIVRDAQFYQRMTLVVPAPSKIYYFDPGTIWDTLQIFANNDPRRVGNVTFEIDLKGVKVQPGTGRLPMGNFHISRTRWNGYMTRKDPDTNAWFTAWFITATVSSS
jgi:hypothetical protein